MDQLNDCYSGNSSAEYINRPDVLDALKINKEWRKRLDGTNKWSNCNKALYRNHQFAYPEVRPFFDYIINNQKIDSFRILIFSGAVDTVCNFVGVSWFIEEVAKANNLKDVAVMIYTKKEAEKIIDILNALEKINWKIFLYKIPIAYPDVQPFFNYIINNQKSSSYAPWLFSKRLAGYSRIYSNSKWKLDVPTVKGAGHFVSVDRPGAALQMINNFLFLTNKDIHK